MAQNIEGNVVVITGASSGLGEATARHLAAQGAKLVLGARRIDIRTTVISPGAVPSELPRSISEADVAHGVAEFYERYAIPADNFARMVAFAMSQPDDVDINEILFHPTAQEL